jgi:hypothetical protein
MPVNSPSSSHAIQTLLRSDPGETTKKYRFVVESDVYRSGATGGPCTIACDHLNDNIYRLRVTGITGGDFYYPYVTSGDSVGRCRVPVGQADGTMVLTGGMNGCAIQVNRLDSNEFEFCHDKNSCSIGKLGAALPGRSVCSIGVSDYMGDTGGAFQMQETGKLSNSVFVTLFEHYIIAVRNGGRWHMVNNSILRSQALAGKSTVFLPYDPTAATVMKSFDDT